MMDITQEELNKLPYDKNVCLHIGMCSFIAQHKQELIEAEIIDEDSFQTYRNSVENFIPEVNEVYVQATNTMLWNIIIASDKNLSAGQNVDIAKLFITTTSAAFQKAQE